MKKYILLFTLLLLASASYAQCYVGLIGGQTNIQSPNKYTTTYSESGGYHFNSTLMHYGVLARVDLENSPIRFTGKLVYQHFSNDDASHTQSMLVYGIGAEYALFSDEWPVQPFLAADILINSFSGTQITFGQYDGIERDPTTSLGAGFGGGLEFKVLNNISLEAVAKYNFDTIAGKATKDDNVKTTTISLTALYKLNL